MFSNKLKATAILAAIAALTCALVLVGCGSSGSGSASAASKSASSSTAASSTSSTSSTSTTSTTSTGYTSQVQADDPYGSGIHHAVITVEGYEPISVELNADAAPVSVSNFAKLANEGYYDGLTFYRFAEDFCMQGGTKGNSASGSDSSLTPIVGEFSQNGVQNPLADDFKKGTVAMARTSAPNSAGSTFFVTLDTSQGVSQSLNGQYAAFGFIDDAGMAIVDQIVADYLPNVTDSTMGAISDVSKQAKIQSIEIVD